MARHERRRVKAVICRAIGPPDTLDVGEHPEPGLGAGDVMVDVKLASINFPDLLIVQGLYQFRAEPPFVPGGEGAGVVSAIGSDVDSVSVGDEVIFTGLAGAFGEKAAVPATSTMPKPPGMTWEHAAAFRFTFGTSHYALKQRGRLGAGDTLVVLGAAGGVGSAAVQLGKAMGATVIAAASSDAKLEFTRSIGADAVINYTTEDLRDRIKELTGGRGADVVYDPVGGDVTEAALRATAWGGRLLVVGFAAGTVPKIPLNLPLLKGCEVVGVFWGSWLEREPSQVRENLAELVAMYESGVIAPQVMEVFDMDRQSEAFAALMNRRATGKVVLRVST